MLSIYIFTIFIVLHQNHGFHLPLIKKERISHRRRLSLPMDNSIDSLTSNDFFYAVLHIGEPQPQRVELALGTGSELPYFACKETCTHCGRHDDAPYLIQDSTSFDWLPCKHELCSIHKNLKIELKQETKKKYLLLRTTHQYGCLNNYQNSNESVCKWSHKYVDTSTISAAVGSDVVSFYKYPNIPSPNALSNIDSLPKERKLRLAFGCSQHESNTVYRQRADGVMGLSMNHRSFFQQLFNNDSDFDLGNKQFAHCFGSDTGGILLFGSNEIDSFINRFNIKPNWTPLLEIQTNGWYRVKTVGFTVTDKLGANQRFITYEDDISKGYHGSVIETGTSTLSMPQKTQKDIMRAILRSVMDQSDKQQIHAQFEWVSDITKNYDFFLQFDGKKVISQDDWNTFTEKYIGLFPDIVMWLDGYKRFTITPEMYLLFKTSHICLDIFGDTESIIIGSNVMLNKFMIYDTQNMKMGVVDFDCDEMFNRSTAVGKHKTSMEATSTFELKLDTVQTHASDGEEQFDTGVSSPFIIYFIYLIVALFVALLVCCVYCINYKKENGNIKYRQISKINKDTDENNNNYTHDTSVLITQ